MVHFLLCNLETLHSSGEFERVRRQGVRYVGKLLVLNAARRASSMPGAGVHLPGQDGTKINVEMEIKPQQSSDGANELVFQSTRWGFVTSKRVGNAVQRNRARRLMREAVQSLSICDGWDIVLIASNAVVAPLIKMQNVQSDLKWLVERARLLNHAPAQPGASS